MMIAKTKPPHPRRLEGQLIEGLLVPFCNAAVNRSVDSKAQPSGLRQLTHRLVTYRLY
jgi:hypothetical protein